jgi:hypothetical protein
MKIKSEPFTEEYYKSFKDVILYHNNELGYYVWSITDARNTEYWVNSFCEFEKAIDLCKKYDYNVLKIHQQLDRRTK